ncbi:hypothetical protein [Streptomyces sp. NPDC006997]|uniref:hypothetical protein n=1 Tax=Streptomyces sp. NPDC006997 TaxID=3155356 RepID=UPI00340ABD9B
MAGTDRVPTPSEITDSIGEGVSYELCQALSKVVNSEAVDSLDITFNWSRVAAAPAGTPLEVEFNREAIAIVERVSDQLKTSVYSREHVIYGLVTDLRRHPDDETGEGGRPGPPPTPQPHHLDGSSRRRLPHSSPLP